MARRSIRRYVNGTARCAVIFLTGHGDVTQTVEQIKLAAVDFLSKPLATAPLTAALQQGGMRQTVCWSIPNTSNVMLLYPSGADNCTVGDKGSLTVILLLKPVFP